MTRRTRIIRRIIIDEYGNERVTEEEVPIDEIENPLEEDDDDQMLVVGAADESTDSPKVPLLTTGQRPVRSAHFEYKLDEAKVKEEQKQAEVPAPKPEPVVEVEEQPEMEFVPIVRSKVPSKRTAIRHEEDPGTKRQVILQPCFSNLNHYFNHLHNNLIS